MLCKVIMNVNEFTINFIVSIELRVHREPFLARSLMWAWLHASNKRTMPNLVVLLRAPKEDDSYQKVARSCLVVRNRLCN